MNIFLRLRTMAVGVFLSLMLIVPQSAYAHHALEFIETESYTTARGGEFVYYLQYDYISESKRDPSLDHWEFTPGIAYGITDRLMADLHFHYAKFENGLIGEEYQLSYEPNGPSPFIEAAAFTLQYRLTEGLWTDAALAGTVEVPLKRARDLLDSEEAYETTLILSRSIAEHSNITLNLTAGFEGSEDYQEYALAFKVPVSANPHGAAAGIEFIGSFDEFKDSWSVLPGIYIPIGSDQTILKTGVEIGKDMEYTRFNVSLMHRM